MKIASWNINSLRARLDAVERLIREENPDVLCLQEIKGTADNLPLKHLQNLGYPHIILNGQKGYHGTLIMSKTPLTDAHTYNWCETGEARHIAAILQTPQGHTTLHSVYAPAGGAIPDTDTNPKFAAKLRFWKNMTRWVLQDTKQTPHVLIGDFNIAHHENDVWNHKIQEKQIGHTPVECQHVFDFEKQTGFIDIGRKFIPPNEPHFTWWTYRLKGLYPDNTPDENKEALGKGWRLDHVWASPDIANNITSYASLSRTRLWDKPSDHAPIIITM